MAKVLAGGFEVRKVEFQSLNYIHFLINTLGKGMNPAIPPAMA